MKKLRASSEAGFSALRETIKVREALDEKVVEHYGVIVQGLADEHGVEIATGQMSDTWQVKTPRARHWRSQWDEREGMDYRYVKVLEQLDLLDELLEEANTGPCNMEHYSPR